MKQCLFLLFISILNVSAFSQEKLVIEKRDYQYVTSIPLGSKRKYIGSEEYSLYLYTYSDSSYFFIIEGDPDYALSEKYYIKALADSIDKYRHYFLEDEFIQKNSKKKNKHDYVFDSEGTFDFSGINDGYNWRLLMSEDVSAGYIGVKNQIELFNSALEKLQLKNAKSNTPYRFSLLDSFENSEYIKISNSQSFDNMKLEDLIYQTIPTKGDYSINRFFACDTVFIDNTSRDVVKSLLTVKINSKGDIVESQLCAKMSCCPTLLILNSNKRMKLKNRFRIKDLELVVPLGDDDFFEEIINNGIVSKKKSSVQSPAIKCKCF